MPNYHVVQRGNKFGVLKEGGSKLSASAKTQKEAEIRGKEICQNAGGGEVRIHTVRGPGKGQIRDSDTVAPGNDSCPPIDKK